MEQIIEFISNNLMLSAAWVILSTMLVLSFTNATSKIIGNQQITTMMNRESALILDIRTKADFNKGHLLGAVNIPSAEIKNSEEELEKYKQSPIILVDAGGMHTAAIAQTLQKMGFEQVSRMQGGLVNWTNDNLPLSKS